MKQNIPPLEKVYVKLPKPLKLVTTQQEANAIYQLCKNSYQTVYPKHKVYRDDPYDMQAYICYAKGKDDEITSTARFTLDSPIGLPTEKFFPPEVDMYRQLGHKLMEVGRFSSSEKCINLVKAYYSAVYHVAKAENVDVIIIVVKDKDVAMHHNLLGAYLLSDDLNIDNGGKYKMSCVAWEVKHTKQRFLDGLV